MSYIRIGNLTVEDNNEVFLVNNIKYPLPKKNPCGFIKFLLMAKSIRSIGDWI